MKVIVTGGAGFIGSNAARRYLQAGHQVVVIDNLSRPGTSRNMTWIRDQGRRLVFHQADIRNEQVIASIFREHADCHRVLHLAGQVAVTTSVADPRMDFEANALGTLNVLEAMRKAEITAPVILSSTNKVYGEMTAHGIALSNGRYCYADLPNGVSEQQPLDFHSPYGCSKGAADQYCRDYHRIYGLNTTVFRQSCIYGDRQLGAEDQGWLAWFMIASHMDWPITVFGDGRQARDILFIDDLLDAYDCAFDNTSTAAGQVYNIGGGPSNVISLVDLLDFIEEQRGSRLPYKCGGWRPGDQKVFVSDIRKAQREIGWVPKINRCVGMTRLYNWITNNLDLFSDALASSSAR